MNIKRHKNWLLVLLFTLHAHNAAAEVGTVLTKGAATGIALVTIGATNWGAVKGKDFAFIVPEAFILMFAAYKMFWQKQPELERNKKLFTDLKVKYIDPKI